MSLALVCYDTLYYDKSIAAIKKTLEVMGSKADKVYWFSDKRIDEELAAPVVWVPIPKIENTTIKSFMRSTNDLCFRLIPQFVDADHSLYIQYDGFAVNANAWTDDFLDYDYIGAPWKDAKVGNGGFSLRSRKLHDVLAKMYVPEYLMNNYAEDSLICRMFRKGLECEAGIKFAPTWLAYQFSVENTPDGDYKKWIGKSFGFHERWHSADYGYDPVELKDARPYK